jgi:hypothetical protein
LSEPPSHGGVRLTDRATSIRQLEGAAKEYPWPMQAVTFIEMVFEPTTRARVEAGNARDRGPGRDGQLGFWELRAMALEWDKEGLTTPLEFVEAVACEAIGHSRHIAIAEMMLRAEVMTRLEEAEWTQDKE